MSRITAIAVAIALLAGGAYLWTSRDAAPALLGLGAAIAQESEGGAAAGAEAPQVREMTMGAADAPVEVIEYASFTCPHCRDFHQGPFEELKADYIDTGKVRLVYREVYFDRPGLWAGMVARCGGEMRYFGIAELLYERQPEWTRAGDPAAIAEELRKIGRTAGLGDEQIEACLTDAAKAQAMVARFEETTQADGIEATPTFVVDGEKVSNTEFTPNFRDILDARLGEG